MVKCPFKITLNKIIYYKCSLSNETTEEKKICCLCLRAAHIQHSDSHYKPTASRHQPTQNRYQFKYSTITKIAWLVLIFLILFFFKYFSLFGYVIFTLLFENVFFRMQKKNATGTKKRIIEIHFGYVWIIVLHL